MSDWKMRREEVDRLIATYRKFRCLWDYRCNEYKLYDFKKQAWQKLAKIFGKEVNTVKRKIKCLRCAYGSEKRKVEDSYTRGQIYRPNLFYYKDLNFLESIIVSRKVGTKFEKIEPTETDPIAEYNEQPTQSNFSDHYETVADEVSLPPSPPPPQKTAAPPLKVIKQQRLAPYYSKLDAAVNTLEEVTKTNSEDSLYTSFGTTIALQLNQLPPLVATATMSDIHQILSKNTIKYMQSLNKHPCENVIEYADEELSESRFGETKHQANEFEEDSVSY